METNTIYGFGILKGGMGKSTTTSTVARLLALYGAKTLVVDLGQPGTTTSSLRDLHSSLNKHGEEFVRMILSLDQMPPRLNRTQSARTIFSKSENLPVDLGGGLHILPYNELLAIAGGRLNSEKTLEEILSAVRDDYDLILIDYPTDLGMLMASAVSATDRIIMTLAPRGEAITGAKDFLNLLGRARSAGKQASLAGILITQAEIGTGRLGATIQSVLGMSPIMGEVPGNKLLPFAVKYSEFYERAYRIGSPIWERTRDAGSWAGYVLLAEWILSDAGLGHMRWNRKGAATLPPETPIIDTYLLRPIPLKSLVSASKREPDLAAAL